MAPEINLPAYHPIASDSSNTNSIYFYRPGEFKDFILSLDDRTMSMYDALRKTFREGSNLKKTILNSEMTVAELISSPDIERAELLERFYNELRETMSPPTKLSLPYDTRKRKDALIDRIGKRHDIDRTKAKYKLTHGRHNDDALVYPFVFEIAAVPLASVLEAGTVKFIGGVNHSTSPVDNYAYFQGQSSDTYKWKNKKTGRTETASSIDDLLRDCGYDNIYLSYSKRKMPSLIVANLVCPRIEYLGGYGKSRIDLRPFASTIAETTTKIVASMPSFHGHGGYSMYDKEWHQSFKKKDKKYFLTQLLRGRWEAVKREPHLKIADRWTQSTVWYRLRPILIENGLEINQGTREYVTGLINTICKESFGVKREKLGIIASPRASLYFDGEWTSVSLDNVESLAEKGTDVIFIEKQGIVEVLVSYADEYGIALVNNVGHLTEYGKDLVEASKTSGAHVTTLTDYDASGIKIAEEIPSEIHRIGIDKQTLTHLGISEQEVEEEYKPESNEINPVINYARLYREKGVEKYSYIDIEFIRKKRIEIDSIVAKVGGAKLWEFIIYKLKKLFLKRNYNRVISMPYVSDIYSDTIQKFLYYLEEVAQSATEEQQKLIKSELESVEGFIENVEDKREQIKNRLKYVLGNDEDMQEISSKLDELVNE